MDGGKAEFLHQRMAGIGRSFTRFDYRGHGLSDGRFADGTIGEWLSDAELVLTRLCGARVTLVGSSMGAWIAMILAKRHPARIAGMVLIAPAPDFPRRLMLPELTVEQRAALDRDGVWYRPSEFEDDPYPITKALIDESTAHEVLDGDFIPVAGPVHILHGDADEVVPMGHARQAAALIKAQPLTFECVEGGGHRLSEPHELERLWRAVTAIP